MKRCLPSPIMSLVVLSAWLLLNQSLAAGQVLLGILFAVLLPLPFATLRPAYGRLVRPALLLPLALRVALDVVVGNLHVMRLILGQRASLAPGFVRVPLELRDPQAIAALAGIVSLTPGTLSADLEADGQLLVHALVATDPAQLAAGIKQRYERPLRRLMGEID